MHRSKSKSNWEPIGKIIKKEKVKDTSGHKWTFGP